MVEQEQPRIQDYGIIGNGRSAALVSRYGAIDWLCWPRFDSTSIFAAILDPNVGGSWRIRPAGRAEITRSYLDDTNILETRFTTAAATIVLTDFMPVASEEEKRKMLWPEHEIVRQLHSQRGETEIQFDFVPRPDYGRAQIAIKDRGSLGLQLDIGRHFLALRSEVKLSVERDRAHALIKIKAGETISFSLVYATEAPAVIPPLDDLVAQKLQLTTNWWRRWVSQANYDGPNHRAVMRSALVLKLLSFAPSGAIVAALTTSLPERIGGDRNWDYRFAWLRDAAFTVRALFGLGYKDDAEAFVNWLLHATRLTRPKLRVLYDVYGERPEEERTLHHLRGYAGSRPVRIGNAASEQNQLDVYGEVVEAVAHFFGNERKLDRQMQQMLRECGEFVCDHWREADHGMWEYRDQPRPYTHSRLMSWVALDRLLQMHARGQLHGIDRSRMGKTRSEIRREIEERAWNSTLESYTQTCGGDGVDANALFLALHDFEDANSERMQKTHRRIREKLQPRSGLLYRDERSIQKGEGAFALCGFWDVDFLARCGRHDEARRVFEAALSHANDLDLFAEEIDPETGDALGNFPQAFTHLGVINAALSLRDSERSGRRVEGE
ncbi:MAG: glycoside hydrolase family 15 protein [Chthoniobacterales bacterium]